MSVSAHIDMHLTKVPEHPRSISTVMRGKIQGYRLVTVEQVTVQTQTSISQLIQVITRGWAHQHRAAIDGKLVQPGPKAVPAQLFFIHCSSDVD